MSAVRPFPELPKVAVEALTLARGERVLCEGLSFAAAAGDYLEIRGANGAGKTSLLRAIAGFARPRAGRVIVKGAEEPMLALHYLGHQNGLKGAASARAHARYWAGLFGAGDGEAALSQVGLARQADIPARVLSQGQARRLALARFVLAQRPIWLLDEPAAGLDDEGRALLARLIAGHCANGGVALAAVHHPIGVDPACAVTLS
jgi:heme exporter protein A